MGFDPAKVRPVSPRTLVPVALLAGALLATPALAEDAVELSAPDADSAWTARILYPVAGRAAPRPRARVVGGLVHYTAFSRRPQVLMVTGSATDDSGRDWVRVQLPRRPNGSSAWVPQDAVQLQSTGVRLRVRLRARKVEVWRDGRRTHSYRAAVGTGGTPTPRGLFAIQDPVVAGEHQRSYLGPYILTLTAHSTVLREFMGGNGLVAIHGTNAPGLLGQAVSNGCVRVANDTIRALWRVARPGTPVEVVNT
jgi:hypothetical protein